MNRDPKLGLTIPLLALVSICGAPREGWAQDVTVANGTIEQVIVTATRREEPLQDVPLDVSVVSGDQMLETGKNNVSDLVSQVPTLNFRSAESNKDEAIFIRGLGTVSTSPGATPSVSTVIDGVVLGRQGEATLDLLDVDHVEVLSGPQGTLFGMNASAGAVNITTKQPTADFHTYLNSAYYEGNEWRESGGLSGTIIPGTVVANLDVLVSHFDGNVTNIYNGEVINGYDRDGARTKWVITPSSNLSVTLIGDYMHSISTAPQGVVVSTTLVAYPTGAVTNFPSFAADLAPAVASADNRTINSDYDSRALDQNFGVSAQADLSLGSYTLTSITAYRGWDNTEYQDQTRLPAPESSYPQEHDKGTLRYGQASQELRITSPKSGFIDYVGGLFFFNGIDSEIYQRTTTAISGTTSTIYTGVTPYGVTNTNIAGYGEANINFSDTLRAILGLRLTHDDVSYHFNRVSSAPVAEPGIQTTFSAQGSTNATGVSGRAGLQYNLTSENMLYGTYSRGYKGPAYNVAFSMLPQDTGVVKPEISNDFEFGSKSTLLGGRMILDLAAFLDNVADYQVPFYDVYNGSPVTRFINAGKVSTKGFEANLTYLITPGLQISLSGAYDDAHIDQFTCPAGTSSSCQVNGKPLTFAPKWKGVLHANYRVALTDDYDFHLGTDWSAQTSEQDSINQTVTTIQPGYGIWNAQIGIITRRQVQLDFVVNNILNKHYDTYLQTFGQGVVAFIPRDATRYIGINLNIPE